MDIAMNNQADEIVWDVSLTLNEMKAVSKALSISVDKLSSKLESAPATWRGRDDGHNELLALTDALSEVRRVYHDILRAA